VVETYDVDRPDVDVRNCSPEIFQSNGLTIVHIALGRIIAKESVHENLFFFFSPPLVGSVLAAEEEGWLDDGGRHYTGADEADHDANEAFDEEPRLISKVRIKRCGTRRTATAIQPTRESPSW
jgi:hypothetical protein